MASIVTDSPPHHKSYNLDISLANMYQYSTIYYKYITVAYLGIPCNVLTIVIISSTLALRNKPIKLFFESSFCGCSCLHCHDPEEVVQP